MRLFERQSQLGGLCLTVEREGFRFDMGGHRFLSDNKELVDDVLALMGEDMLRSTRKSVIFLNGRVFGYPIVARDLLRNLTLSQNAQALADLLRNRTLGYLKGPRDGSLEDWIVSRYGETMYGIFFRTYSEKLWGAPPREISADWASQLISLLSLWNEALTLVKVVTGRRRKDADLYYYPRLGFGQLFERIGAKVVEQGVHVHLNTTVKELVTEGSSVVAVRVDEKGEERVYPSDYVISSMPLTVMVKALSCGPSSEVLESSERLKFRAMRFCNIMLDQPDVSDNTWIYVHDPEKVMTRIQEPKRRSPHMAPEGRTSLMLEIPCSVESDLWSMSDDALLDRCLRDLKGLGIDVADRILGYFSTRNATGYPIYSLDYNVHRARLLSALERYENLIPCGRQGVFRYISSNTAMEMGMEAAKYVLGENSIGRKEIPEISHLRERAIIYSP